MPFTKDEGLCQNAGMQGEIAVKPMLLESLYTEAMLLADEARAYFAADGTGHGEVSLDSAVAFSCESLKVTTRLMHSIAWLLAQRDAATGVGHPHDNERRIGYTPEPDWTVVTRFPPKAQHLINSSVQLYERLKRLEEATACESDVTPVHSLRDRIRAAF